MISVIIPTLNEAANLPPLLRALRQQRETDFEIIVADGGSKDITTRIAQKHGCKVVTTTSGRGQQLSAGIEIALGEILLFLHADSVFPAMGLKAINRHLQQNPNLIGGNFHLTFDGKDDFSIWLNSFYANIRKRGFYYGDSGIFIRSEICKKIGGIKPISLMEDYSLVRRMEKYGQTCCVSEPGLITSSRRFIGRRNYSIIWGWVKIHLLFYLGLCPDHLARIYKSTRQ